MIKLSNIRCPAAKGRDGLLPAAAQMLGISLSDITEFRLLRLSVDSRKKPDVFFVATAAISVQNEESLLKNTKLAIGRYEPDLYAFPFSCLNADVRPVIVGMGPAGLFAALCLADSGLPCTIIERGRPVEERVRDVTAFWETGVLDESSNVQFGEGGAGAFSDGKLTTGVSDGRVPFVFRQLVRFGAPEDILYLSKPHIGTDKLCGVLKNMRAYLIEKGCDIRFESRLADITVDGGKLSALVIEAAGSTYELPATHLILAPGNSARDTFRMLHRRGLHMEAKSFSVGVRIEHLQSDIDMAQYGQAATLGTLPASDYKLAVHLPSGRSIYTFCVCPGGSVVAATSQRGHTVTNGMSEYARGNTNINGGLLVGVTPDDFGGALFGGVDFQELLERSAFRHGGGGYEAPAQLVRDFLQKRPSVSAGRIMPSYRPAVRFCNLWNVLPGFVCESIAEALPLMDKKIKGFASGDAVLTAVETRSSSPVRIIRDARFMSNIYGIFPCGEGAGYAGGISSAAADGIKCAEALCRSLGAV